MTNITSRQQCMCVFNTIEIFRQFIIAAKYVKQIDNYNCCNIFFPFERDTKYSASNIFGTVTRYITKLNRFKVYLIYVR